MYFLNIGLMGEVDGTDTYLHRLVDAVAFRVQPDASRVHPAMSTSKWRRRCIPRMTAGASPTRAAPGIVVVAGMHRAGTSVVARGFAALGVDLGDRLMSADVRMNARGFFEDLDVVAIDDALLAALSADWKSVALLDATDWGGGLLGRAARRRAARARRAHARAPPFGFKDPRVPRLLPFWQRVFAEARSPTRTSSPSAIRARSSIR